MATPNRNRSANRVKPKLSGYGWNWESYRAPILRRWGRIEEAESAEREAAIYRERLADQGVLVDG